MRFEPAGITWRRCAENLYREKGINEPSMRAVTAWMYSSGYRGNIPDSKLTGPGMRTVSEHDGTVVVVQEFLSG
jgi:uncharacterized protein YkwD